MKTLKDDGEISKLIELFGDKTGCREQFNNCPCNTCFHSLNDLEGTDFKHIVWLLLLGLRGDYDSDSILKAIEEELKK